MGVFIHISFTVLEYTVIIVNINKGEDACMMSFSTGLIAAGACLACFVFARSFLQVSRVKDYKKAFWFKGAAGLCFLALGLIMAAEGADPGFARFTVLGLAFGLLGDQLLALRFLHPMKHDLFFTAGAGAFSVGHALYILALYGLAKGVSPVFIPVWLLGLAACWGYARKSRYDAGKLRFGAMVYLALVALMWAVACAAAIKSFSVGALLFALGGLCFVISDNILCAFCFGQKKSFSENIALHASYYAAQLLIALSIAFV